MEKKIAVIGYGVYAKSLINALIDVNTYKIGIVSNYYNNEDNRFKKIEFEDLKNYQIALLTTSSSKVQTSIENIYKNHFEGTLVNFVKGLSKEGFVHDRIISFDKNASYAFVAGAAFASDIIQGSKVEFNISTEDRKVYNEVRSIFLPSKVSFTYYNNPQIGELVSSLKNIYSIYLGYINATVNIETERAIAFQKCIIEIQKIINEFQSDPSIIFSSAAIGDIFLSGTSLSSRNYFYGYSLGRLNNSSKNFLAEGVNTIEFIETLIPRLIYDKLKIIKKVKSIYSQKSDLEVGVKQTVVLTYGTFDLFHYGHLELLKRAKNRGDQLIVGLSTDDFNKMKGKKSIQSYEEREQNLLALNLVDRVIPEHSWDQKIDDIKNFAVDIFIMGSDWKGEFDTLSEHCQVEYLNRTKGISTTMLKSNLGG